MTADVTRRDALKFAGAITLAASVRLAFPNNMSIPAAKGYGTDPDLLKRTVTWSKTLNGRQLAALETLCDIVLPEEPPHPSAGAIGVHEFLDEWLSAPYPQMRADRKVILVGLAALDNATLKETGLSFTQASPSQQGEAFDRACTAEATVEFARRLVELVCGGYYTTREGHAAIGYVGNTALASFPGPPEEIVRHLERQFEAL